MKSWILKKLSQLESYLSVPKEDKKKIDIWSLAYMLFIGFYLSFWISYTDVNHYVTFLVFVALAGLAFFNNILLLRFKLVAVLVMSAPIINSLCYNVDNRIMKLSILSLLVILVFFTNGKKLIKIVRLIIVVNIAFCLLLIPLYYLAKFPNNISKRPPIAKVVSDNDQESAIYIILLDAFPAKEVLENYFGLQSGLHKFLINEGFTEEGYITNYRATQQSIPNLFSGTVFKANSEYSNKDLPIMKTLIPGKYIAEYSRKYHYDLEVHSLLLEGNNNLTQHMFGRGNDFSIYLFPVINRLLTYLPFLEDSNDKEINQQTETRLEQLHASLENPNKKLAFFHFLTFHGSHYDVGYQTQMKLELAKADALGIKIVEMIMKAKPNAKIIVTSDHGVRFPIIKNADTYKGILYIKN